MRKQREKEKGGSERIERVDSVLPRFPNSHPRSLVVPHIPAPHVSVAQVELGRVRACRHDHTALGWPILH